MSLEDQRALQPRAFSSDRSLDRRRNTTSGAGGKRLTPPGFGAGGGVANGRGVVRRPQSGSFHSGASSSSPRSQPLPRKDPSPAPDHGKEEEEEERRVGRRRRGLSKMLSRVLPWKRSGEVDQLRRQNEEMRREIERLRSMAASGGMASWAESPSAPPSAVPAAPNPLPNLATPQPKHPSPPSASSSTPLPPVFSPSPSLGPEDALLPHHTTLCSSSDEGEEEGGPVVSNEEARLQGLGEGEEGDEGGSDKEGGGEGGGHESPQGGNERGMARRASKEDEGRQGDKDTPAEAPPSPPGRSRAASVSSRVCALSPPSPPASPLHFAPPRSLSLPFGSHEVPLVDDEPRRDDEANCPKGESGRAVAAGDGGGDGARASAAPAVPPPPPPLPFGKRSSLPPPPPPPPPGPVSGGGQAPSVKTKQLHWNRILLSRSSGAGNTIWDAIGAAEPGSDFDMQDLEMTFQAAPPKSLGLRKPKKQSNKRKKVLDQLNTSPDARTVRVLSAKRSQAIEIMLANIGDNGRVLAALDRLDPLVLGVDRVGLILKQFPTKEELLEMDRVWADEDEEGEEGKKGDKDKRVWGKAEAWCLAMRGAVRAKDRLQCWEFDMLFEERCEEITRPLDTIDAACKCLQSCESLREFLALVLAFGNFLNGSNARTGHADGFEISLLDKISQVKSADGRTNLLAYILLQQAVRGAEVQQLLSDLDVVGPAARVDLAEVNADLTALAAEAHSITSLADEALGDAGMVGAPRDSFEGLVASLHEKIPRVKELQERWAWTSQEFQGVVDFFGGMSGGASHTPAEFFSLWTTFLGVYRANIPSFHLVKKEREQREQRVKQSHGEGKRRKGIDHPGRMSIDMRKVPKFSELMHGPEHDDIFGDVLETFRGSSAGVAGGGGGGGRAAGAGAVAADGLLAPRGPRQQHDKSSMASLFDQLLPPPAPRK